MLAGRWRFVYSSERGEEEMQTQLGSASQAAAAEAFCDTANTIDRFKGTCMYMYNIHVHIMYIYEAYIHGHVHVDVPVHIYRNMEERSKCHLTFFTHSVFGSKIYFLMVYKKQNFLHELTNQYIGKEFM